VIVPIHGASYDDWHRQTAGCQGYNGVGSPLSANGQLPAGNFVRTGEFLCGKDRRQSTGDQKNSRHPAKTPSAGFAAGRFVRLGFDATHLRIGITGHQLLCGSKKGQPIRHDHIQVRRRKNQLVENIDQNRLRNRAMYDGAILVCECADANIWRITGTITDAIL